MKKGKIQQILIFSVITAMIISSVGSVIGAGAEPETPDNGWGIFQFTASPTRTEINKYVYFTLILDEGSSDDSSEDSDSDEDSQESNQIDNIIEISSDEEVDEFTFVTLAQPDSKYYYQVNFGDKKSIAGYTDEEHIEFRHLYKEAGEYRPEVSVKHLEKDEIKEQMLSELIIVEGGNMEPVAVINAPYTAQMEQTVTFDGSGSYDTDGQIVSYLWSLQDNTAGNGQLFQHTFYEVGSYKIKLEVTDDGGLKSSDTFFIYVEEGDVKPTPITGDPDQSQTDTNGGSFKIYGSVAAGQSFSTDKYGLLNEIKINVERDFETVNDDSTDSDGTETESGNNNGFSSSSDNSGFPLLRKFSTLENSGFFNFLKSLFTKISNFVQSRTRNNGDTSSGNGGDDTEGGIVSRNGNIKITLRKDSIDGDIVTSRSINPEDIPLRSQRWVTFNFGSLEIELGKKYFIEVSQNGGDKNHFYRWYYGNGDCYSNGEGYVKENGNWESFGNDFAFETYGEEDPNQGDGIVRKWALVIGTGLNSNDNYGIYAKNGASIINTLLSSNGCNTIYLKDADKDTIKQGINTIMEKEDADDIVLFHYAGHGVIRDDGYRSSLMPFGGQLIYANELDEMFNNFNSEKNIFIFDCCFSGGFITATYNLARNGRLILTSCTAEEESRAVLTEATVALSYYLHKSLQMQSLDDDAQGEKGYREISLDEVYQYVYNSVMNGVTVPQHPQFYNGIDEEVGITNY